MLASLLKPPYHHISIKLILEELQDLTSGACCVTALIEGKELVISNVGDCRAVLCRGGVAEALTEDHRASHADERKRIENKALLE